ncbi:MAG TPA: DNA methyltransferase [Opitutaceae bacterium]
MAPSEPIYQDEQVRLYNAEWEEIREELPEVDAIICDPPYGQGTLDGYRTSRKTEDESGPHAGAEYEGWSARDVFRFVWGLAARNRGWWFAMTSHDLIPAYEHAFDEIGLYRFAPISIVFPANPRFAGDGPCSQTVYGMVARPKESRFLGWGSLPGSYSVPTRGTGSGRGKPYDLMLKIVCDYSREGMTVLDPFSGSGMTGRVAKDACRNVILVERDKKVAAESVSILKARRAWQQSLIGGT